ncbi:hypothetical protein [Micromonospora sp. LHW51205]|uniref:hypothetical protein n=1 Tax=Micromonospora sp. LHW51205 TaxID=2248752 RepID=UPI001314ED37|nr:hypothetical protein [Micromonospora sp. LHW51205]
MDPHRMTWPGGRCPDGAAVPQPPRPAPPARRHLLAGWTVAAVVLVLMVAGIAGWTL